jgi:hypothetical protein
VLAIQLVLGTYTMATILARRYAPAGTAAGIQARFVHSLVPIAFGYTVAHYFSFAVFQGQAGYLLATDPLGRGWDLLGTVGRSIDYTLVTTRTIALVQVAAIVTGHIIGVVAAHDRAVATDPRPCQRRQLGRAAVPVARTDPGRRLPHPRRPVPANEAWSGGGRGLSASRHILSRAGGANETSVGLS